MTGTTYAAAGVDIAAGDAAVDLMGEHLVRTRRPGVINLLGGFASGFQLPAGRYREPVIVTSTDGVGTKLLLARQLGDLRGAGIDAVAMCVNDLAVTGAEPLVVLDYVATGALVPGQVAEVVAGIADGCTLAGCSLVGGETAELPGMYADGELDVACFAVGVAERASLLRADDVREGDALVALASDGLHSNGFSLVRRVLADAGIDTTSRAALEATAAGIGGLDALGLPLAEELLRPTRIYARSLARLRERCTIHAAAHITGGGIPGNLPRVLPPGLGYRLEEGSWPVPPIFDAVARLGGIAPDEMTRVFNRGIGIVLAVPPADATLVIERAHGLGERAYLVGEVVAA